MKKIDKSGSRKLQLIKLPAKKPRYINRREFVKNSAVATAALGLYHMLPGLIARPKKPNIVYILADQWRASATGYAGDPNVKTPNLNHLASESFNFRNAVSVCPVCTPHRASLMTGRYPTSTGMFLNDAHLPETELCIADVLSEAGYKTAYIGKWHLDGHGRTSYIPPERRQGFDYWKAAECDHNYNHSHYYKDNSDEQLFWEGYDVFAQTKDAQQFIRNHANSSEPFALFVSYGPPHFPLDTAPEEYKALYPPEKIKLAANVPQEMKADAQNAAQGYYAHCTALDKSIGDLIKLLDESGLKENTILVFTSDHGEMLGAQGISPKTKQVPWSESAGVPLLIRFPAINRNRGRIINMPITTPDIFPTLFGLAGLKIPASVEGDDISAFIREGKEKEKHAVLYMGVSPWIQIHGDWAKEYRAIRTDRYTYVLGLEGPWLMYDDAKDPFQINNLASKAEYAAIRRELHGQLISLLKKIGDDFKPGAYYLDKWSYDVAPHKSVSYYGNTIKPQTPKLKSSN